MKKAIIILSAVVAILCFYSLLNKHDMQGQITQLQQEVAALQKMNGIVPSYEISNDTIDSPMPSESNKTNNDGQQPVKSSAEQTAVEAIKYCLKMYVPDFKYNNIRSVPQSDGTVDVVVDYKSKYSEVEHTYYNVSVYSNNEFKVNYTRGLEGNFPYNSKMMIQ